MISSVRSWLAILLCIAPFLSGAAPFLPPNSWLEDSKGQLAYPEIERYAQAFVPFNGVLAKGYTASTYWLRLQVPATSEERVVIRIRPSYLDHIELFDPLLRAQGKPDLPASGDRHAWADQNYTSLNHGFTIPGSPETRTVYLRVQSASTLLIYPQVMTVQQANQADHRQELLYSIYLGLLTTFLAWALLQWAASRETLIALFIAKQAVVLAHALAIQGYLALMFQDSLSPHFIDRLATALVLTYVASSALFNFMLLREFKPVKWVWRIFMLLLLVYVPVVALFVMGDIRLALQINMVMAAVESVGILLTSLSTRIWDERSPAHTPPLPRWVLVSFHVALVMAAFSSAVPSLGSMDTAEWALNSPMFAGFVSSLLMTVLLSLRARNLDKQRQQSLLEAQLLEQRASNERQRREEQERFLSMLTHELKTPLGVARISLGASDLGGPHRDRIDRALSNINAIIDRCAITDKMEHHKLEPQIHQCDLGEVINDCVQGSTDPARVKVSESNESVIRTDSGLLATCLANLIDNALKYSPPASTVHVKLEPDAAVGISIKVSNALGMAGAPDSSQLFSKYYRSPGALSKSGSGLGLYLTHSLAELLGARVTHRVEGENVEFCLWLPA